MPKLMERVGNSASKGSITGLYTVLVEGDDFNEPVADTIRSIVDGHIVLSRDLAARNQYPAIDMLRSISRVMPDIVNEEHLDLARSIKKLMAVYEDARDLINIGAYASGNNADIDNAIQYIGAINAFLAQRVEEKADMEQALAGMRCVLATGRN
jgi:flagellum-specific ATP synthase